MLRMILDVVQGMIGQDVIGGVASILLQVVKDWHLNLTKSPNVLGED